MPFRYVWPSELDLMAELAGMRLRERWSGWRREPFTSESRKHVSVWEKPATDRGGRAAAEAWLREYVEPVGPLEVVRERMGDRRSDEFPASHRSYAPTPKKEAKVASITKLGRVIIPVSDQDAAIAFYTEKLGFSVTADIPYGNGDRWIEVAPPDGGAAIALSTPMGGFQAGRETGIALETSDARAAHEELKGQGIDVDRT